MSENALITLPEDVQRSLQAEWDLPWREARKLMRIAGSGSVSEEGVKQAVEMAKQYRLPIRTIAFIPGGTSGMQPYVTADGYRWAFRMDSRKAKSVTTEILQLPNDDNGNICIVKATVGFQEEGSFYNGHGAASNEKKGRSNFALEDVIMLAETKALRRAIMNAVGLAFPIFEDALDVMKRGLQATVDKNVRVVDVSSAVLPSAEADSPKNMIDVVKRATVELSMSMEEINTKLGVTQAFGYSDPEKAWRILSTEEGVIEDEVIK